jgi:hypothetical protein
VIPGYCECGCGTWLGFWKENCTKRGQVAGEPKRFVRGHRARVGRATLEERFWSKVERVEGDSCWKWLGGKNSQKYGAFFIDGRNWPAHRISYELVVGEIPEGLVLDHLCRNTSCVNPAHLEPVTNAENVLRGEGVTAANRRKTHCPMGHPYSEPNTGVSAGKRYCRACRAVRQKANQEQRNARQRERRRKARATS